MYGNECLEFGALKCMILKERKKLEKAYKSYIFNKYNMGKKNLEFQYFKKYLEKKNFNGYLVEKFLTIHHP